MFCPSTSPGQIRMKKMALNFFCRQWNGCCFTFHFSKDCRDISAWRGKFKLNSSDKDLFSKCGRYFFSSPPWLSLVLPDQTLLWVVGFVVKSRQDKKGFYCHMLYARTLLSQMVWVRIRQWAEIVLHAFCVSQWTLRCTMCHAKFLLSAYLLLSLFSVR